MGGCGTTKTKIGDTWLSFFATAKGDKPKASATTIKPQALSFPFAQCRHCRALCESHLPRAPLNFPERLGQQRVVVFKFYAFLRSQIFTKRKKKKKTGLILAGKKKTKYESSLEGCVRLTVLFWRLGR